MKTEEIIRSAVKSNKAVIGYKETVKCLKNNSPKMIIIAKNIPEEFKKEIEHNVKIYKVNIEIFEDSSKELGILCGKPFPVTALAIKD